MSLTGRHLTSAPSEADAGYDRMQGGADMLILWRTGRHSPEEPLAETVAMTDSESGASVSS